MPASKAQIKANNKYNKNNYDRLNLIVPKGQKVIIQEYAKKQGKSLNTYIIDLVKADMNINIFDNQENNSNQDTNSKNNNSDDTQE